MSTYEDQDQPEARRATALLWWSLVGFVALLTAAGALLWWRYGAVIFVDLLATLQACF